MFILYLFSFYRKSKDKHAPSSNYVLGATRLFLPIDMNEDIDFDFLRLYIVAWRWNRCWVISGHKKH